MKRWMMAVLALAACDDGSAPPALDAHPDALALDAGEATNAATAPDAAITDDWQLNITPAGD